MSTHEDFDMWIEGQLRDGNPYPDLLDAWQAATALRDAEIAQLKAVTKPLAEALREMLRFPPASVFVSACDALNSYDEANK